MDYLKLSKEMSYILRHHPEEYNLTLDENGFVEVEKLLDALNKNEYQRQITLKEITHVIEISDKKRLEIIDGKIRALYGHSLERKVKHQEAKPPKYLYHGTSHKAVDNILIEGLCPMKRQFVHLSADINTAVMVGKRRDSNPIILEINSEMAYEAGIKFYVGNESIWLAERIPAQYIKKI